MSWNTSKGLNNPWGTEGMVSTPLAPRERVQGEGAGPGQSEAHQYPPSYDWGGAYVKPIIPLDDGQTSWTAPMVMPSPNDSVELQADGTSTTADDWKTTNTPWIQKAAPHMDTQRTDATEAVEQRHWATDTTMSGPIIPVQVPSTIPSPWQSSVTPETLAIPNHSGLLEEGVQNHPILPSATLAFQPRPGLENSERVSEGSQFNPWARGGEPQVQEANPLQDVFFFSGSGVPSSQRLAKLLEAGRKQGDERPLEGIELLEAGAMTGQKRGNEWLLEEDTEVIKKRILGDNPAFAIPAISEQNPRPGSSNSNEKVIPRSQHDQNVNSLNEIQPVNPKGSATTVGRASEVSGSPDNSGSNQVQCWGLSGSEGHSDTSTYRTTVSWRQFLSNWKQSFAF